MAYHVFARKWRPRNFSEMAGQQHVVQALSNALAAGRLHHAYLLTGTRGVGKTTIARIIATCLNCEQGVGPEPCGTCHACSAIRAGQFADLIEVDAASRTKVEDTRELLDNVQYLPSVGRYKIYLIDEVHALSAHSFNALLKTLEEPPEHSKFLLATTAPEKLPATVISRCLQFHLRPLSCAQLSQHLAQVLKQEGVDFAASALDVIAEAAGGSVRDALSLLDQAVAASSGRLEAPLVQELLGCVPDTVMHSLLLAVAQGDAAQVLQQIKAISQAGVDYGVLFDAMMNALHRVARYHVVPTSADDEAQDKALAAVLSPEDAQLFYDIALAGRRELTVSEAPHRSFEMAALRMIAFQPSAARNTAPLAQHAAKPASVPAAGGRSRQAKPPEATQTQAASVETKPPSVSTQTEQPVVTQSAQQPSPRQAKPSSVKKRTQPQAPQPPLQKQQEEPEKADCQRLKAPSAAPEVNQEHWPAIVQQLTLTGIARTLLKNCTLAAVNQGEVTLHLAREKAPLLNPTQTQRIQQALTDYCQRAVRVTILLADETQQTPQQQENEQQQLEQAQRLRKVQEDPQVQSILSAFDGKIREETVRRTDEDA